MTEETLQKANKLEEQIKEYRNVLQRLIDKLYE